MEGRGRSSNRRRRTPRSPRTSRATWEGALDVNGITLRLTLKLANVDGGATGTLISLDQGDAEIPLRVIEQTNAHLKFTVPAVGGSYEGDLKDGQLVGTWTQGPGTLPLELQALGEVGPAATTFRLDIRPEAILFFGLNVNPKAV